MIDWRKNIQSVLKNHAGSSPIYIEMGASHILTQEDRDILLKELMGYKIEIIVPKEFQDWVTYVDNKRN